jgi:hypothetical protein
VRTLSAASLGGRGPSPRPMNEHAPQRHDHARGHCKAAAAARLASVRARCREQRGNSEAPLALGRGPAPSRHQPPLHLPCPGPFIPSCPNRPRAGPIGPHSIAPFFPKTLPIVTARGLSLASTPPPPPRSQPVRADATARLGAGGFANPPPTPDCRFRPPGRGRRLHASAGAIGPGQQGRGGARLAPICYGCAAPAYFSGRGGRGRREEGSRAGRQRRNATEGAPPPPPAAAPRAALPALGQLCLEALRVTALTDEAAAPVKLLGAKVCGQRVLFQLPPKAGHELRARHPAGPARARVWVGGPAGGGARGGRRALGQRRRRAPPRGLPARAARCRRCVPRPAARPPGCHPRQQRPPALPAGVLLPAPRRPCRPASCSQRPASPAGRRPAPSAPPLERLAPLLPPPPPPPPRGGTPAPTPPTSRRPAPAAAA